LSFVMNSVRSVANPTSNTNNAPGFFNLDDRCER
jgi:hypothetical protein